MKVVKDNVVYILHDAQGNVIEENADLLVYLHGVWGYFPPKYKMFWKASNGREGAVQLEPHEVFGEYDEALIQLESRGSFTFSCESWYMA